MVLVAVIICCDYRILKLEDVSERIYSSVEKVLRKIR